MSRIVSDDMTARWLDQFKMADQRPVCRAIIQRQNVKKFEYDTAWTQGGTFDTTKHRTGWFTSMIFGDESSYREIPNVLGCSWDRSIGQDAATCQLTVLNTQMTAIGEPRDNPTSPDELDKPGYFTFNRGEPTESANRWGYDTETGWNGIFVPDMVVKTFEGYGCDRTVTPFLDENLMQSGVWMIDDVEYRHDGLITLTMRDLGRLLISDNIAFPPIVPRGEYPLTWIKTHSENVANRDAVGGAWSGKLKDFGTASSSNEAYIGQGLTNEPFARYVGPSGGVEDHHPSHALYGDNDNDLYWRSTGQDEANDYVWWQFTPYDPMPVAALRIKASGGPYRVYISIDDGTGWVGKRKIGYHLNGITGSPGNIDIDANIPFVRAVIADRFYAQDWNIPEVLTAERVRLTFTRLGQHLGEHPFRGGLRQLQLYTADNAGDLSYEDGEVLKVVGNYSDFTDIVKWVCAWSGFYWPPNDTGKDFIRIQDGNGGSLNYVSFAHPDPKLPKGRVWGDFMKTGTAGEADLTAEQFDKRPLMDCVSEGTLVKTPIGYVPVEEVGLGEPVANRGGWGTVTGKKSQLVDAVVSVVLDGEEIVTSAGHLYLTESGWARADELREGDYVRRHLSTVRTGVQGRTSECRELRRPMSQGVARLRSVWRALLGQPDSAGSPEDLFGGVPKVTGSRVSTTTPGPHLPRLRRDLPGRCWEEVLLPTVSLQGADVPHGVPLYDVRGAVPPQDESSEDMLAQVPEDSNVGRHDRGAVRGSVPALAGAWARRLAARGLDLAVRGPGRGRRHAAGLDAPRPPGRRGGRWGRPSVTEQEGEGREAGRLADGARVDRVEVHRRGDPEWTRFSGRDGQARLWDLSIDGDPSFVVGKGEFVVHNCINYVRDLTGYLFFVDETGGAVWRMPNLGLSPTMPFRLGNYLSPTSALDRSPAFRGRYGRTDEIVELDERENLLSYTTKLSSQSIRERIFVGNSVGGIGTVIKGFNPYPIGLRRIAGWTDQHFETKRETKVMADMISARSMFAYRRATSVIPGYPKIQCDDMIRIFERVTNETFYHYVLGIKSDMNVETGEWTYTVDSHWLGEEPEDAWIVDVTELDGATQAYLEAIGYVPEDSEDNGSEDPATNLP